MDSLPFDPSAIPRISAIAIASTAALEVLSFILIYRKPRYAVAVRALEDAQANVDSIKAKMGEKDSLKESKRTVFERKLKSAEDNKSSIAAGVTSLTMAPNFIGTVCNLVITRWLKGSYNGIIVGVLPFVPYQFLTKVTQIGLPKDGTIPVNGVSFLFVWILLQMGVKAIFRTMISWKAPEGTGISNVVDSPVMKNLMKRWGFSDDYIKNMSNVVNGKYVGAEGEVEGEKKAAKTKKIGNGKKRN